MSRFAKISVGDRVRFLAIVFSRDLQDHKNKEGDVVNILRQKKCCSGGDYYEIEFDDGEKVTTVKRNLELVKEKDDVND